MPIYELDHVSKQYPKQDQLANDDISFCIEAGEIFGLLGDNGAGKSTLIKQMVNLLASTTGQIRFEGKPLTANSLEIPLRVGYMPQHRGAINQLTVGEAIYFTAHLRGASRAVARSERDRLLDLWQLTPLAHKPAPKLSGGEARLLQLAVAMAGSPSVLVLDEPTNELSPQRRHLVWETLRQLNQKAGTTILFITHDAIEAEKIIQRVGILVEGRLAAIGKPADLKRAIDQKLRLELFFDPQTPPTLPADLAVKTLDAGRWLVWLRRDQLDQTLPRILDQPIEDFRLYSATLEDLYMQYAAFPSTIS